MNYNEQGIQAFQENVMRMLLNYLQKQLRQSLKMLLAM